MGLRVAWRLLMSPSGRYLLHLLRCSAAVDCNPARPIDRPIRCLPEASKELAHKGE
jgi:hypothetical protein